MDRASNPEILRAAVMPTRIDAAVEAIKAYENAPQVQTATSAAERSLQAHHGFPPGRP